MSSSITYLYICAISATKDTQHTQTLCVETVSSVVSWGNKAKRKCPFMQEDMLVAVL